MDTSKLKPNDPRVKWEKAEIRGKTYHYMLGEPQGTPKDTMLLVHGWPDISFGWRHQVPYFMSLGYRVIVPDMIGFGRTDAPQDLKHYTLKSSSTDMRELVQKYVGEKGQIVLGGHDWGGFLVWRMAEWYPELIKCVFSVCTPHTQASKEYRDLAKLIQAGILTNFTYQLQLAGPDVEANLQGREKIGQFISAIYGGIKDYSQSPFTVDHGVHFDRLDQAIKPPLLSDEELKYYIDEYSRRGAPEMRGGLNWYRTRQLNYEEELELAEKGQKVQPPALFISATRDRALPPSMSQGMEEGFEDLSRDEVNATHWALVEAADDVNRIITEWLNKVLNGSQAKASL